MADRFRWTYVPEYQNSYCDINVNGVKSTAWKSQWTFSQEQNDWYGTIEIDGEQRMVWLSQYYVEPSRRDSGVAAPQGEASSYRTVTTASASQDVLPYGTIRGTAGNIDRLDPDYYVRPPSFFKFGKMFSYLHCETAGETMKDGKKGVSVVRFGEKCFANIRRWVVIEENKHFVFALPVSTYGGRATTKPDIDPNEHAIICMAGNTPQYVAGETELRKYPIYVQPAHSRVTLDPASRINFAKPYPIEKNVKVKDMGDVDASYQKFLLAYYHEHRKP